MNASIITIGDELLIGQTIDTNSAFIAKKLNEIGIWVKRKITVGDLFDDIWNALDNELGYSQVVIITGGLGPTADDITKPLLCKYFDGVLVENKVVLRHIKYLFASVYNRQGPLSESNRKQAQVPNTCTVLHNANGSAPGMWFEKQNNKDQKVIFISLPGVPYEMKGLLMQEVMPKLSQLSNQVVLHRTAVTAGLGESLIAERIKEFENNLPLNIRLAYLPNYGMVKLRLTIVGMDKEKLIMEIDLQFEQLTNQLDDIIISRNDTPPETLISELLVKREKTLSTAESCTGGNIAHWITRVPGAAAYYKGGVVSYANEIKENNLLVKHHIIQQYGAVSREVVEAMAKGALEMLHTDYAIASSGIMGPDGGTPNKPVGTVWIAAANRAQIKTRLLHLRFDRERNIEITTMQALLLLRELIQR